MTIASKAAGMLVRSLEDVLACPLCKGTLRSGPAVLLCSGCGASFPQSRDDCVDLMPADPAGEPDWAARQHEMEAWYRDMATTEWARACFDRDYAPFADILASCRGAVLDLGGGAGVTRHWLRGITRYVVLDPSLLWLDPAWSELADAFPCLAAAPPFVRGTGERLPFLPESFDVVLAFWTLNHAMRPDRLFAEVARVLAPGGVFLVVLEDMEPRWRDLLRTPLRRGGALATARMAARKAAARLPGRAWPVQSDHTRIRETDLARWSASLLDLRWRRWMGGYLACEYARPGSR